jgi:hypothetical protein
MKAPKSLIILLALTGSLLCAPQNISAQSYSIDWFTVDGGGGTSTGGVYSVSGTIGQPDAGTMSGGNYTIQGGFWSVIAAIQTQGAPLLTITRSGPSAIVSWPSPSTGFVLQETASLGNATWTNVAQPPVDNGTNKSITITPPVGNKFYRLKK